MKEAAWGPESQDGHGVWRAPGDRRPDKADRWDSAIGLCRKAGAPSSGSRPVRACLPFTFGVDDEQKREALLMAGMSERKRGVALLSQGHSSARDVCQSRVHGATRSPNYHVSRLIRFALSLMWSFPELDG